MNTSRLLNTSILIKRFYRHLIKTPLFAFGLFVVIITLFLTVFGPQIVPYNPERANGLETHLPPPSLKEVPSLILSSLRGEQTKPVHWFGTDSAGLDIFSRVLVAPRTDVRIGLIATIFSLLLGTFLGLLAGYYKNWASELLMRVSDVSQAFPVFILAMVLVALGGRNTNNIILALVVVYTPVYIRLTRSASISIRNLPFVESARAMGNKEFVIALKHVLPNALTPSLVQASINVGWAILLTAGLSFVGAGVRPPTPEWGSMISLGAGLIILGEWWPSVFPGIAISIAVFGYAIIGNTLDETYGGN
jgi:peptide/nickel transport system permease protein